MNIFRPKTLDEALELARQPGALAQAARPEIVDALGLAPTSFVDVRDVPELKTIKAVPTGYEVGAALTLQQVADLPDLDPAIRRALTRAIPPDERAVATVAETLLVPNRFPEWLVLLVALDVGIELIHADGTRTTRSFADRFGRDLKMKPDTGIISTVHLNGYAKRKQSIGLSFAARASDEPPIVCAGVYVQLGLEGDVDIDWNVVWGISDELISMVHIPGIEEHPFTTARIEKGIRKLKLKATYRDENASAGERAEMAKRCLRNALLESLAGLEKS